MYSIKRPPVEFGAKMANKYIKELKVSSELLKQATTEIKKPQELLPTPTPQPTQENTQQTPTTEKKIIDEDLSKFLEEKLEKMDGVLLALKEQQLMFNNNLKTFSETSQNINKDSINELKSAISNVSNTIKNNLVNSTTHLTIPTPENVIEPPAIVKPEKKQKKTYYQISDKIWEDTIIKNYPEMPPEYRELIYGDGVDYYVCNKKKKSKLNDKEMLKILNKKRKSAKKADNKVE